MLLQFSVLLILITGCLCVFQDCGTKPQTLLGMSVTDCSPQDNRCILRKNKQITFSITFKNVRTNNVTSKACGKLPTGRNCIPFPLPEPDGCKSGINCPVTPDATNTYSATFNVLPIFPRVSVDVVWQLLDDSGNKFICVVIPSTIR